MEGKGSRRGNSGGDGKTPEKSDKRGNGGDKDIPPKKRAKTTEEANAAADVAMVETAAPSVERAADIENPAVPAEGGVPADDATSEGGGSIYSVDRAGDEEDMKVDIATQADFIVFLGVYLKRKFPGRYTGFSYSDAVAEYFASVSRGGDDENRGLEGEFGIPSDVHSFNRADVFSTGFGLGLLSPSENDGNAGAPGKPYDKKYGRVQLAKAEKDGHYVYAEGTGSAYPCTVAAGFNMGAHLGHDIDLGSGIPTGKLEAVRKVVLEEGRHPYGRTEDAPVQDKTKVDLSMPVIDERATVQPQCRANPVRHAGRTGHDTMGPGFPNHTIVQNAYQRFASDMGFKVVEPPASHGTSLVSGLARQPDPSRADSIYSGSRFASDQQSLYSGTGCLYSPVVTRADACAAGTSAFGLGLQNALFPNAQSSREGLDRILKALNDAQDSEKRKNLDEVIEGFRSAGCHCVPETEADMVAALEARNTILFFGYYMYTAQAVYSEEVLGRVKAQKRSEHNCDYYRRVADKEGAPSSLKLETLLESGEETFRDLLREFGPPRNEQERQKYAQAITVQKRLPNDNLGPYECYDVHWNRNANTGYTVQYGNGDAQLLDCRSHTLYFQLCCQLCEPISMGLAPVRAPGDLGTTATNIAQNWMMFLDQAESSGRLRDAERRALEVRTDRICHLVVTRALESLLIAARVEMELRVRDLACPVYLGAVADPNAQQKFLAGERVSALTLLYYHLKLSEMPTLPEDIEALRRHCSENLSLLEIEEYYQPESEMGNKGKISGYGYIDEVRPGFDAGMQSFRKFLLVLSQAAARHGDGVSYGAHRTLYSLCHYSLTSRTCPVNDLSLSGSQAMCGRMSKYVGPSFHHAMYDTAVSLQGGSFELAKVLEVRLAGGTANLMLCRFAAALAASDSGAPYRWLSNSCETGTKAENVMYYLSYAEQYNLDFPIAGVCGQLNDPSNRTSMAKSRGLDELLVGMVAVGAVLPDSAAFLYEPTFLLQGVKLAGREMTSLDEKVVFRVGDLSVGQFLAKEVMQHLKDCGQFENRSSSSGVVDYTLDDLAYGTAAVIAKSWWRLPTSAPTSRCTRALWCSTACPGAGASTRL